jgi:hypothetical protein
MVPAVHIIRPKFRKIGPTENFEFVVFEKKNKKKVIKIQARIYFKPSSLFRFCNAVFFRFFQFFCVPPHILFNVCVLLVRDAFELCKY